MLLEKNYAKWGSNEWDILNYIQKFESVYVYGAGMYGNILVNDLKARNCKVEAVVVTSKKGNPNTIAGIPVVGLEDVIAGDRNLFVLGVSERYTTEITNLLMMHGHSHIMILENAFILHGGVEPRMEPKIPKLEITAKIGCRIRCHYCPQQLLWNAYFDNNSQRIAQMKLEDYKTCILRMPKDTIISFAGFVEPFHHPDAVEMILFAHEMGYKVELYTTLDGLTLDQYHLIKDIPFINVVLHTPDKKNYANIHITDEYWKIVDLALGQKKPNGMNFIKRANCQSLPSEEFLKVARGRIKVETELIDRAGNLDSDEGLRASAYKTENIYCNIAYCQNHWVLLPDGTVTLCCMDFALRHVIGNLLSSSYEELLHGEAYMSIRRQMMNLEESSGLLCRSCTESVRLKNQSTI